MQPKLEMRSVSKTFLKSVSRGKFVRVKALKDISFQINEAEFVSFIGSSGCGKTTLLKILDGLIEKDSGDVLINSKPVIGSGPDRGIVFQSFNLFPWRDVTGNVELGLEIQGLPKEKRREIAKKYIELVGLTEFEKHHPHELSGGMQQRVGLARALAIDPEILLMDEPFGYLDAQTRELLQDELLQIWHKTRKTVVFVTHDIDEAVYLADRIMVMTPRPGSIKEIIDVDLPRPRWMHNTRACARFGELRTHIRDRLREDWNRMRRSPP